MEIGQRQFNGLLMGVGTDYHIFDEAGLTTLTVRSGTRPAPRAAGSIPGLHVADSKRVVLTLKIYGTPSELEERDATLRAAMTVSEAEQFQYRFRTHFGDEGFVWARVLDRPGKHDLDTELVGYLERRVGFEVADPRIYSVDQHSEPVPILSTAGGGIDFPNDFPANWSASVQSSATLVNAGDADAYPLFRFQFPAGGSGDCTGVEVTNLTNGDVLDIDSTITVGQTLIVDMDAYVRAVPDSLIVHIDASSHFGNWQHPRNPFRLSPGPNEIQFEVTGSTTDIVCLATWRDTSL